MNLLFANLLFAVVWLFVTGSFAMVNFLFGFALGAGVLYLLREQVGAAGYVTRAGRILSLTALFLYELVMSAWKVARLVVSPRMDLKPGIMAYRLTVDRDFEITLLANLITLTPGTLSVDVSGDGRTLFIHAIDCSDPEQTRRDIAQGFERKIMEAFR